MSKNYHYYVETSGSSYGQALFVTKAEALDFFDGKPLMEEDVRRLWQGNFQWTRYGSVYSSGCCYVIKKEDGAERWYDTNFG